MAKKECPNGRSRFKELNVRFLEAEAVTVAHTTAFESAFLQTYGSLATDKLKGRFSFLGNLYLEGIPDAMQSRLMLSGKESSLVSSAREVYKKGFDSFWDAVIEMAPFTLKSEQVSEIGMPVIRVLQCYVHTLSFSSEKYDGIGRSPQEWLKLGGSKERLLAVRKALVGVAELADPAQLPPSTYTSSVAWTRDFSSAVANLEQEVALLSQHVREAAGFSVGGRQPELVPAAEQTDLVAFMLYCVGLTADSIRLLWDAQEYGTKAETLRQHKMRVHNAVARAKKALLLA